MSEFVGRDVTELLGKERALSPLYYYPEVESLIRAEVPKQIDQLMKAAGLTSGPNITPDLIYNVEDFNLRGHSRGGAMIIRVGSQPTRDGVYRIAVDHNEGYGFSEAQKTAMGLIACRRELVEVGGRLSLGRPLKELIILGNQRREQSQKPSAFGKQFAVMQIR